MIIQSQIKTIVYLSDEKATQSRVIASKEMLDAAEIGYTQFIPREGKEQIFIDFKIEKN